MSNSRPEYITALGKKKLERELKTLYNDTRPEVIRALSAAAAEGDRSENAEYIYRKKQLREIDRRLRYLIKQNETVRVVDRLPDDQSRIFFGAWVRVESICSENETEISEKTYRLVGHDETDLTNNWISIHSPLAKALLGKQVDDEVVVHLPNGQARYRVCGIRYQEE